jgi:hypothetical protein
MPPRSLQSLDTYSVTVLHAEVVVLEVDVDVRENELLTDLLPDDTSHLITVHLNDGVLGLDTLDASRRRGVSLSRHVGEEDARGEGERGASSKSRTRKGEELNDKREVVSFITREGEGVMKREQATLGGR